MKKSVLAAASVVLFLSTSLCALAQMPPPPPGALGLGPAPAGAAIAGGPAQPGLPPDQVLKDLLGFTDAQLTAVKALGETRRLAAEALGKQLGDAHKALADAMNATAPDPKTVGTAFIQIDTLQKQFKPIDDAYRTGFNNLLTADQRTKVEGMKALDVQLRGMDALKRINVF